MLTIFMAIAAAYLFGLGIIGGVIIKGLLQIKREQGKISISLEIILTGFHFCLTMGGILVAATLLGKYKADVTDEMRFASAIIIFVMVGLLFVVAKEWNRLLMKEKRDVDSE